MRNPLPVLLAVMTGGVLSIGLMTLKLTEKPTEQSQIENLTVVANQETLPVEIEANGIVKPVERVNISPKTAGRLERLLVDQGMIVKKGQPLAVMENREIFAQGIEAESRFKEAVATFEAAKVRIQGEIQQAQMQWEQAKAKARETEANLKQAQERIPRDINQNQAQVEAAKSRFGLAQARLQRNQQLLKEGAISQDQYDEAWNEYLNAGANLGEIQQKLEQSKSTASPEVQQLQQAIIQQQAMVAEAKILLEQRKQSAQAELAQLQASAQAAKAGVGQVQIQYQDSVIRAPFDGIITQKYADVGAFVTPTTSASSTASATSSSILALARGVEILAKVPEVDIALLRMGQPVSIRADAYPNQSFQGKVIKIAPEAVVQDNVTSFEVTIGLIDGKQQLLSNMNVDVTFLGQQLGSALVVPTVAIVTEKGETGVMVPDKENKPKFKPVTIGLVLNDKTQILSGLTPGERVFIDLPEDAWKEKNKEKDKEKK